MASKLRAWMDRPGIPVRVAIAVTILAVLFLAPIYLQHQWAAAQVAVAPWYVAMVRVPFFAGIMMFTYYPGYWVLLYATAALAVALWAYAVWHHRKFRRALKAGVSGPSGKSGGPFPIAA